MALQDRAIKLVHRAGSLHSNADGFSRQSWTVDTNSDLVLSACPAGPSLVGGDVGLPRKEKDRDEKTKGDKEKKTEKHRDVGGA